MPSTLVLTREYSPHRIVSWQDAVTDLFAGRCEVVESYDTDLRSTSLVIKCPAVVRLLDAIPGGKRAVKFSRINILTRDKFMCLYCGRGPLAARDLTYDHVLPRCQGGRTEWTNIVSACRPCNGRKEGRTPAQAGMSLRRAPVRPAWLPITMLRLDAVGRVPKEWQAYWTVALEQG